MKKFKIRFKLRANCSAAIIAANKVEAVEKLLAKDVVDIIEISNIEESDLDGIEVEVVDYQKN